MNNTKEFNHPSQSLYNESLKMPYQSNVMMNDYYQPPPYPNPIQGNPIPMLSHQNEKYKGPATDQLTNSFFPMPTRSPIVIPSEMPFATKDRQNQIICKRYLINNCFIKKCPFSHDTRNYPCRYLWTGKCHKKDCNYNHKNFTCVEQKIEFIIDNKDFLLQKYNSGCNFDLGYEFEYFIKTLLPYQQSSDPFPNRQPYYDFQQPKQVYQQPPPMDSYHYKTSYVLNEESKINDSSRHNLFEYSPTQQDPQVFQPFSSQTQPQVQAEFNQNINQEINNLQKKNSAEDMAYFIKENKNDPSVQDLLQRLKQYQKNQDKNKNALDSLVQNQDTFDQKIKSLGFITRQEDQDCKDPRIIP